MEVLTGRQMRNIDRRAIEACGIPGIELMRAAGRGVAEALIHDYPSARAVGVLVACGKGNNGGDGLVAARHLARLGVDPRVILLAPAASLSRDAATSLHDAREAGVIVHEIDAAPAELDAALGSARVVVDAMLGTGVRGSARPPVADVIERINASGRVVISVDVPSGVDADSGVVEGPVVRAHRTYTLCRPKLALLLDPAADYAGEWRVIPIGIPDDAVRAEGVTTFHIDEVFAASPLAPRPHSSHKGDFGHVLVVAGSRGMSGAAVLAARGALRSGAGLVTVATAESARAEVASQQPELMTRGLAESREGAVVAEAVDEALRLVAARDALVLGPGLGRTAGTRQFVRGVVEHASTPAVLDADALNAIVEPGGPPELPDALAGRAVLTPHPGEAARLLGVSSADVQRERLDSARSLARGTGTVVVLKGRRTVVAAPDGRAAFNSTGNPGMATGGTGDVLAGVIGASIARGSDPWRAACTAVFVHGRAGDRARDRLGSEGLIAGDVADELPHAFRELAERAGEADD